MLLFSKIFESAISIYSINHTWSKQGNYEIKVKAKDEYGATSEWSDPLSFSMPKTKLFNNFDTWITRLIQRFPFLEFLL